jgi:hypothetical protein
VQSENGPIIEKLDSLLSKAHVAQGRAVCSELSEDEPAASFPLLNSDPFPKELTKKLRRAPNPLTSMLGPKCLRFAGIVQNGGLRQRKRSSVMSESSSPSSGFDVSKGVNPPTPIDADQECLESVRNPEGFELTVVLPFERAQPQVSGVNLLLGADSLIDVEGFVADRDNPIIQHAEAEKLLLVQQGLGMHFEAGEIDPINRMVTMEIRDREKNMVDKESNRSQ